MTETNDALIKRRLGDAEEILITGHIRPDGDAVGSLLGLGLSLLEAGKNVQMVLPDGLPSVFRHLDGSELVKTSVDGAIDTFITVDSADFRRIHEDLHAFGTPALNIDHHITNENYAELNLVEADSVSTTSILTEHIPAWGLRITEAAAAALLTGLITDSLGFRTSNMNPKALRQAADLMELGIDLPQLYYKAQVSRSFKAAHYWGAGLSSLERDGQIVWAELTIESRKQVGYHGNDDADLINVLSAIEECPIALVFVEQSHDGVKVSWRARGKKWDVASIASGFGGGGHRAAAGATIEGSLDDIKPRVLRATREILFG